MRRQNDGDGHGWGEVVEVDQGGGGVSDAGAYLSQVALPNARRCIACYCRMQVGTVEMLKKMCYCKWQT